MAVPRFAYPIILSLCVLALAFVAGRLSAQWRPLWSIEGNWQGVYFQDLGDQLIKMDYRLHTEGKRINADVKYSDSGEFLGEQQMDLVYLGKTPDTNRNLFSLENPPDDAQFRVDNSLRLPYILKLDKNHYFALQRMNQGFIGTVFHRIEPPPDKAL